MQPLIVDTGFANIISVKRALEFLGYFPIVSKDPRVISRSGSLILPGVGNFQHVIKHLRDLHITDAILESLQNPNHKILGICLGLQLLADSSEEGGSELGLGLIRGNCKKITPSYDIKIPHIGFNSIQKIRESKLLSGIPEMHDFYFIHSYCFSPGLTPSTTAITEYGQSISSIIEFEDRIFGTQFHPEKSQKTGLKIFSNFLSI